MPVAVRHSLGAAVAVAALLPAAAAAQRPAPVGAQVRVHTPAAAAAAAEGRLAGVTADSIFLRERGVRTAYARAAVERVEVSAGYPHRARDLVLGALGGGLAGGATAFVTTDGVLCPASVGSVCPDPKGRNTLVGAAVGAAAGALVGGVLSHERWVPARLGGAER